jgi:hypothetical protein
MTAGRSYRKLVATLAVLFALLPAVPAFADRVDDLAQMLSSSSDKTRITAVVSLARLGDKRTLKPLVTALHDPNAQVRALAATALGHLGHKAALPALRSAAIDDTDDVVRKRAREATLAVARSNNLPVDLPGTEIVAAQAGPHGSGFGRSPHAVEDRPDLYIVVKTSSDDSPGKADKNTRKAHADIVRNALVDSFRAAPQVTMAETEAQRWGLDARHIDLSVVKMEIVQNGGYVEVNAELRLAISDETGKMLSFLSGGAKVQVPRSKFNPSFLPEMRKEALESAMHGMFDKLLAHLRDTSQS